MHQEPSDPLRRSEVLKDRLRGPEGKRGVRQGRVCGGDGREDAVAQQEEVWVIPPKSSRRVDRYYWCLLRWHY